MSYTNLNETSIYPSTNTTQSQPHYSNEQSQPFILSTQYQSHQHQPSYNYNYNQNQQQYTNSSLINTNQPSRIKSIGPGQSNCCARYWLTTGLLILLTTSLLILGAGLLMYTVTNNNYTQLRGPSQYKWRRGNCTVPDMSIEPDYSVKFFAPCHRGFECNICQIPNVTLIYDSIQMIQQQNMNEEYERYQFESLNDDIVLNNNFNEQQKYTTDMMIGNDLSEEECLKINIDRWFPCSYSLQPKREDNTNNNIKYKKSIQHQSQSSQSNLIPSSPSTSSSPSTQLSITDDNDKEIILLTIMEYNLDRKAYKKQLHSSIIVLAIGIVLFITYLIMVLFRFCILSCALRFPWCKFLSPLFCIKYCLFRCCCRRYSNMNNGDNNGSMKNNGQNNTNDTNFQNDLLFWPKTDVILDENNEDTYQFDLHSSDDEEKKFTKLNTTTTIPSLSSQQSLPPSQQQLLLQQQHHQQQLLQQQQQQQQYNLYQSNSHLTATSNQSFNTIQPNNTSNLYHSNVNNNSQQFQSNNNNNNLHSSQFNTAPFQ